MGLTIADFVRDREPNLVRLKFLACLRNLNLPDTCTPVVMHDVHAIPFLLKVLANLTTTNGEGKSWLKSTTTCGPGHQESVTGPVSS